MGRIGDIMGDMQRPDSPAYKSCQPQMHWKIADMIFDIPKWVYEEAGDDSAYGKARPLHKQCNYFTENIFYFLNLIQLHDTLNPDGTTDGTDDKKFDAKDFFKEFGV